MNLNKIPLILLLVSTQLFAQVDSLILQPGATAGKDAMAWSFYPNNNNATSTEALVAAWTNGGNPSNKRFYIEFNLSTLPSGTLVDSAFLFLYHHPSTVAHGGTHNGANSFYVRRITSAWTENSLTWNNKPTSSSINQVLVPNTTSGSQNFKINVKALTQDLIDSNNYGFSLRLASETTYKAIVCASSDHSNSNVRPALKVYYNSCTYPEAGFIPSTVGKMVSFTDTTNSTTIYNRLWDFGDGTFSTQQNPTKTYTTSGVYNACLIITDSCGTDTACQIINLCTPPKPVIMYSINGATIQFQGKPNNATSYYWDFGDGNFTTIQNPLYTYSYGGNYDVCLSIIDSCGADTSCTTIAIPNIGIDEDKIQIFSVYPNPSRSEFRINGPVEKIQKISIYNCTGQLVKSLDPRLDIIDIESLGTGIYFVQIKTKEEDVILKVIKL